MNGGHKRLFKGFQSTFSNPCLHSLIAKQPSIGEANSRLTTRKDCETNTTILLPYGASLKRKLQDLPEDLVKSQLLNHSYLVELLGPQAWSDAIREEEKCPRWEPAKKTNVTLIIVKYHYLKNSVYFALIWIMRTFFNRI